VRYIVFPSFGANKIDLHEICPPSEIVKGPTESGLYLLEIQTKDLDWYQMILGDAYVLMPDFD
jgi:hypothetical protein